MAYQEMIANQRMKLIWETPKRGAIYGKDLRGYKLPHAAICLTMTGFKKLQSLK